MIGGQPVVIVNGGCIKLGEDCCIHKAELFKGL